MKMRKLFAAACLLSSVTLYVEGGYAIDKKTNLTENNYTTDAQQKEIIKKYKAGESFKQGDSEYTIYPELVLEYGKQAEKSKSDKKVVKTQNFSIFEASSDPVSGKNKPTKVKGQSVVYNKTTGKFAVFNGKIIVQLKEGQTFSDPNFKISKSFPNLGYIILEKAENMSVNESIAKLKANSSVENVTVEVLENFQEPL